MLILTWQANVRQCEAEIREFFVMAMKRCILMYIVEDVAERVRLQIPFVPALWPALIVRAPVPWHTPLLKAREALFHRYCLGNPVLLELRRMWHERYQNIFIVDMEKMQAEVPFPQYTNEFTENLNKLCAATRAELEENWLIDVADTMIKMRHHWSGYVAKKRNESTSRVESFFRCIRALMSHQIRGLVERSVAHFAQHLCAYSEGNAFEGPYRDYMFIKRPIIRVKVIGHPGTNNITFEPGLEAIKTIVIKWFQAIIKVSQALPSVDKIMYPTTNRPEPMLMGVFPDERYMLDVISEAVRQVSINKPGPRAFLASYDDYFYILNGEAKQDLLAFFAQEPPPYLKDFSARIYMYEKLRDEILFLRRDIPLNMVMLDCAPINDTLWDIVNGLRMYIVDHFINVNRKWNRGICNTYEDMAARASETPETTAQLVELINYIMDCRDAAMFDLREKARTTAEYVLFLMQHAHLTFEDVNLNTRVFIWPLDMEETIDLTLKTLNTKKIMAEDKLRSRKTIFEDKLKKHEKELELFRRFDPPLLNLDLLQDAVERVDAIFRNLMEDKYEAEYIINEETLLDQEVSVYYSLQTMISGIEPFHKLWHTAHDFYDGYEKWYHGPFEGLAAEQIAEDVEAWWKLLYKLGKQLYEYPGAKRIADMVRNKVEKFKVLLPVLCAICNKGMRDRHWAKISELVGTEVVHEPTTTLADMVEQGVHVYAAQLEEIEQTASKEYALEKALNKMKEEWVGVKFEVVPYRDTGVGILTGLDDIQQLLDDHILKSQTMRGSPYVKAFEADMIAWEEKLISMQDILDQWLTCQATWMYLEPIFSSEDIMRQMPTEARNFRDVDKEWKTIMAATMKDPMVLEATDYPGLLKILKYNNVLLEDIQRGLNDYLEKKRLFFPRFFFLSNDELLEILSETKDPMRVQPHLKKCFEGIYTLEFNYLKEIVGMASSEGESVKLSSTIQPADAKGMVERWLQQLEHQMMVSLRDVASEAITSYVTTRREDWVLIWPGQIVQSGACVEYTLETIEAIETNSLPQQIERSTDQINGLVYLVQGDLKPGNRITVEALIVLDVHGRSIQEELLDREVMDITDFNWISQLRYYWRGEKMICSMITTDVEYGFEYLGNIGRLVATPLTDRCFRTLMSALKLNLGGAPEGPAGTGKTETTKDLAKAVAKKCVVFNCSDGLDYKALGKFFKGLAQSGAWACFDEFNRIELEVLSVVAQQILSIQLAILRREKRFVFEGTEISLNPSCSVFITMNPGYAGRTELPDNLKVLFRTVAMMVPDYAMIGEITLYSNGFVHAGPLARKIVQAYKLCSEQLSSQNHYDYGMRAVKSVLLASGALKKNYPEKDEAQLVLRAIIDVNMPKFLSQDVPLFMGIYTDLFPGIEIPQPDRAELTRCILKELDKRNLQATEWYLEKIIQVYEMMLVRHGFMIVGAPMGGKTQAYQTLADSLRALQLTKPPPRHKEFGAIYRILNPKAITMGQLYGCFDPASHEWTDGVLAIAFREYAMSITRDRKWILFDGPVDAVWIENMNTVLDDNKKLCLMSGEIIQMTNKMNLIFEAADLEFASPATVSRCGMIYMEPEMLGWRAFLSSYNVYLNKKLIPEQYELIQELIDWLVQPILDFLNSKCTAFVKVGEIHQFHSFARLFTVLLDAEAQFSTVWLQCTFVFCLLWGLCAIINGDSRKLLDAFFRKLLEGNNAHYPKPKSFKLAKNQLFPDKDTVFDYLYDKRNNGTWISWMELEKEVPLLPTAKVNDIIILTNENACLRYFVNKMVRATTPILIVGPTGTGKSSMVLNYLLSLPKERYITNTITFSARTTANQTQDIIMSKVDRRRKGVFGPSMGKKCLLFVDDLSMPQKEQYGAQPPLELLRQWIDHGHWYDLKDMVRQEVVDVLFVSAMLPPGGGSNLISSRLTRHMLLVTLDSFEDNTLNKIFGTIMDWHFSKGFIEALQRQAKAIVAATMEVYKAVTLQFLPTPSKCHYLFNLRDFARVIKGILLVPATHMKDLNKLVILWIHEAYRVFYDRLADDADREKLYDVVYKAVYNNFRVHMDAVLQEMGYIPEGEKCGNRHACNIFFGNYMEPDADPKIYDQVLSLEDMASKMEYYLEEYNVVTSSPMALVMFRYALDHISRCTRVLLQDNGNLLLVGVGGSGRSSAVKLAASILEMNVIQIEISRVYGVNEWRDDIRKLLMKAGIIGKPLVFLFADNQIMYEGMVEDINMLLNTGDIPNLYGMDEKVEILDKMQTAVRESGKKIETTPLAMFGFYVERVKANLRIVMSMSPIGDSFRNRLRMFPSLINCATIDWFTAWPSDALERVAHMFIFEMEDVDDELRLACVDMCQLFHTTVVQLSDRFYKEQRRMVYVTPTSYLELIKAFMSLYALKVNQITMSRIRYETGLEQLDFAAGQVAVMQQNLRDLQPLLVETSDKTEKLMIKIEQDTVVVEKQKEIVGADEALANEAAAAAQAIKDDCESDLAEAVPALEAALDALNTLKPADITLVKSMKNPPSGVKLVMEAVCVMKGIKGDRKVDANGKPFEDYWGPSQKMLGDMKFLESLKNYDKDNIPNSVMKRIRERYIPDRDFDPAVIAKVSSACEGLCRWVRAMDVYDRVIKVVAPKKAALFEAESELQQQMNTLNAKRAQLQGVLDKLQTLNDEFAEMTRKKKGLEDEIHLCSTKLTRAEQLIGGLGGEKARWTDLARDLQELLSNIIGDVLLSAGCIAYLGPFTVNYRGEIVQIWNKRARLLRIPCSETFSLIATLGEPVVIRVWNIAGLPVDNYSIQNGIIVMKARRWALMIDPQEQANKWVKNMERENQLKVIKLTDPNYGRVLENAIQLGFPVMLENIRETLDALLEPVLLRNVFRSGGVDCLKLGDNILEYNHNFRFYITTRLSNPHYLPEVAVKVTLLNFMITPQGLQDQLLGIVVAQDRPELELKKNQLIVEGAHNKRTLKEIEDKILEVLSSAGNILEDESANLILSSSRVLSIEIEAKQAAAAITEAEIDKARLLYVPVSQHSSVLFFCISDLANIDPMYQYSLVWFINLYNQAIINSPKSDELSERLEGLNAFFTKSIYDNVCRSLFEKDKLIFSLVLTLGILRSKGKLDDDLVAFLLTGGVALDNPYENPAAGWLSDKAWSEVVRSSNLNALKDFKSHFEKNVGKWKSFYDLSAPHENPMPEPFDQLEGIPKLIVLRCIRPDKLIPLVQQYVVKEMGRPYIEPPPFDLDKSYNDSNCCSPLIFILSPGSDPMSGLVKFATEKKAVTFETISLGQGQGPIASGMISKAIVTGGWVVLQNCHVMTSWMGELERICAEVIVPQSTHSNFRCWLTSYPSTSFPVTVLQNGVKMTNEAPKGLKNNIYRSYISDPICDPEFYISCPRTEDWRRLLYALCFFHAIVQERRAFGPLGWNIQYEFNESDLRICVMQLQMFLTDYAETPFDALNYLAGECNYGGRVTDDKDRRLIMSLLSIFYNDQVTTVPEYSFSPSGDYRMPKSMDYNSVLEHIRALPMITNPEVFGLHENADITKDNNETTALLFGTLLTQTHIVSGGGAEGGEGGGVVELTHDMMERLPKLYDVQAVADKYPVLYYNSMNTVLKQELIRYNRLLSVVKRTLHGVHMASQGLAIMSSELEECNNSFAKGKVPGAWMSKSYPSMKPLGSYVSDLLSRLSFLQDWIDEGPPVVFWISGFYFTQSFLTGVLQNFSRHNKIPIDQVHFEFTITSMEADTKDEPEYGVYCKGLFLEGARWNRVTMQMDESYPKILFDTIPIIWFKPALIADFKPPPCYFCPIYKTSERKGVLATTGHSSNFVMYITLETDKKEQHWINRGVASLTQLDD
ncbi:dynein axonemal heavy chain 3 isoform X6 [Spodoptera frugiperda]|nr:dynein axonemal heavy chain 3 isoform X6 [Spodoptera frugiperda]XP_050560803.1 dynein axonemal heavy chain 3 isoform X6 [Spodoptera frugiperda]XP_050560804.1 dynein axonemal heavy chain 3 isoform X6 [Spodoptera frugiperda]XP_050560805.1 dynein axonemal heavy chain 3 isoform X6 [Spodoptera frugiperda]XP_050560806.1 dynein axonemal heavy chain 3 isoform X6 [Spodoptera frugiperda]XP_050560807.1 dynein axonemal heavy chain 3 isoform X6 [Spodoptera frugiperda]XP_050560808.1 dynein axonemal heav